MELAVILLVAIIALGPSKTMETARTLGRIMREARRTFTEVMDAAAWSGDGDDDSDGRRRRDRQGDGNQDGGAVGAAADKPVQPPDTLLDGPAHLAGLRDDADGDDGVAAADGAAAVDAETQRGGERKA